MGRLGHASVPTKSKFIEGAVPNPFQFRNGLLVEHRAMLDDRGFLKLGVSAI